MMAAFTRPLPMPVWSPVMNPAPRDMLSMASAMASTCSPAKRPASSAGVLVAQFLGDEGVNVPVLFAQVLQRVADGAAMFLGMSVPREADWLARLIDVLKVGTLGDGGLFLGLWRGRRRGLLFRGRVFLWTSCLTGGFLRSSAEAGASSTTRARTADPAPRAISAGLLPSSGT